MNGGGMNMEAVEKIADAVLYEGYLLYPYRQSAVKNRQRFNFGVLYPLEYCVTRNGSDAWEMKTECLVSGSPAAGIEVKVRFLQMVEREGRQEGLERSVGIPEVTLAAIAWRRFRTEFAFDEAIGGELELWASRLGESLFKVTLRIRNRSKPGSPPDMNREDMLLHSFVSVHSILRVTNGEFVSLLDPPERYKTAAAACENTGTWPVLAGDEERRDTVLSSPIILYDYPRIAPESAENLFDGTEIDEILALRILTLTDAEKREVMNGDERARRILERTETLPPEHFQKLHGALRELKGLR